MSHLKNLQEATSLHDLADLLGYRPKSLAYIVYKIPSDRKYQELEIPKSSGGIRKINAPTEQLKAVQRRLANILYGCQEELFAEQRQRPLSHGFRKGYSIATNAKPHIGRRYVLNVDLSDYFPSFNFGRVRGYFIKNKKFELHKSVATIIAQIACHNNTLPQGSPCSPIISELVVGILDARLVKLASKNNLTYTRYADDLTFSTNQKTFPSDLAERSKLSKQASTKKTTFKTWLIDFLGMQRGESNNDDRYEWTLGRILIREIENCGFRVNHSKTRMQVKQSRQTVTGLTVNRKVNIRSDYYRQTRSMCNNLFKTGEYFRPQDIKNRDPSEAISNLDPIHGILNHVFTIKNLSDLRDDSEKRSCPSGTQKLYAKFLRYRYFVCLERPLILCEGKTDNIYLRCAIRNLPAHQPLLGEWGDVEPGAISRKFKFAVSFFSYTNVSHKVMGLGGGSPGIKYTILNYSEWMKDYVNRPLSYPVIMLIDNDAGAKEIFSVVKNKYNISITLSSGDAFYYLADNLYLVKTPEPKNGDNSSIEDCFDPALLLTELDGKKFNRNKKHKTDGEYGKQVFAERVVRPNSNTINFTGFAPLLERISSVIDHHNSLSK